MRSKLIGISIALLVHFASAAGAQTPTPTFTVPTPTVTPPPHVYLSEPTLANTYTSSNQRRASVAVGADGNYLIVWNSDAAQLGYYDIKGQLFTHDGVKIGGEFQVDQAGANRVEYTPDVAADGAGNYVVVWADFNQTVTDSEVFMRRYDGAANPLAGAVQVNTYTTAKQRLPRVAADPAGRFVVVWESEGQDGSGFGVFGQKYDETGAPADGEFAVNQATTADQVRASVDMDAEGFTVLFEDGLAGVAAREFDTISSNQFPVFPSNRRFADVVRLDGTSNTLFVAENTSSGGIDGIRTENGVPQSPFPLASSGFNPRLGRNSTFPSPAERIPLVTTSTLDTVIVKDVRWFGATGRLDEVGRPIDLFGGTIADVATGPGDLFVVAAQNGTSPGSDVTHVRGGDPDPLYQGPDPDLDPILRPGATVDLFTLLTSPLGMLLLEAELSSYQVSGLAAGAGLVIDDSTASFGTVAPGVPTNCKDATGDCYRVTPQGPRPSTHWDEPVVETLSTGLHKTWLLHVGSSFADVPSTNPFEVFIENLLHNGVTAGGACGGYCPSDGVKRQQMAVFLLKSRYGPSFTPPPATGTIFTDVTLANPFAAWIEALYLLGITGGCSGGPPPAPTQFCPDAIVNRQQMAVFLLKTLEGSAYAPPAAAGIFQDVPLTNPFVKWIEELYARQVTGGCVVSPLQYCPANPTNRQQMAAFLTKTFALQLYGP